MRTFSVTCMDGLKWIPMRQEQWSGEFHNKREAQTMFDDESAIRRHTPLSITPSMYKQGWAKVESASYVRQPEVIPA